MKRGDRNEKKLVICYKNGMDVLYNIAVAPLAGAWIEITKTIRTTETTAICEAAFLVAPRKFP